MDFELPGENHPARKAVRAWFETNPRPNGRQLAERSSWNQVRLQWEAAFSEVIADLPIGTSQPALAASRANTL